MEDEKPENATPDLTTPDSYHADVVSKAVKFTVSLFLGRGQYETTEATTLEEAEALAEVMVDGHPTIKSKPIITAYDAEGNNVVIGKEYKGGGRATATAPLDTPEAAALQEMADEAGWEAAAPPAPPAPAKAKARAKGPAKGKAKAKAPAKGKAPPAARKAPAKGKDKARRKADPTARPAAPLKHGQRWTKEIAAQWDERAASGELPPVPDFSAPTHSSHRKRLEQIVAMVMAGDLAGLRKDETKPVSSSRVILCRYRDYAIKALMAKAMEKKRSAKAKEKTN
jgi:hypothetical protein